MVGIGDLREHLLHSRIRFFFFSIAVYWHYRSDVDIKSCTGKNRAAPRIMQPDIDDMPAYLKRSPFFFALSGS
jgi:hypothetical protein